MNRRQFLTTSSAGMTIGLIGCLSEGGGEENDEWSPGIDGTEPEVSPGEEATLTVEAADVAGLNFSEPPDRDTIEFPTTDYDISPSPAHQDDSDPPIWYWESRTSIEVNVSIRIADDATPGDYPYSVRGLDSDELASAESITEEFTITVIED